MTPTLTEAKRAADAEIARCRDVTHARWGLYCNPSVAWNLKGLTAGKANPRDFRIRLNPQLAEHGEEAVRATAAHEYAHLVACTLWPRCAPHGPQWASVMRALGHPPERCHSFAFQRARTVELTRFVCECAGQIHELGPVRANRALLRLNLRGSTGFSCRRCHTYIKPDYSA